MAITISKFVESKGISIEKAERMSVYLIDLDHDRVDFRNPQYLHDLDWDEYYILGGRFTKHGLFLPSFYSSWDPNALSYIDENDVDFVIYEKG